MNIYCSSYVTKEIELLNETLRKSELINHRMIRTIDRFIQGIVNAYPIISDANCEKQFHIIKEQIKRKVNPIEANYLLDRLDKLRRNLLPTKETARCDWLMEKIKEGESQAIFLSTNFENLGLGLSVLERLSLCFAIVDRGEKPAEILADSFDRLGLEEVGLHHRLELCTKIAGSGWKAASTLASKFDTLGFPNDAISERLALCATIAKQAPDRLVEHFDKLGFHGCALSTHLAILDIITKNEYGFTTIFFLDKLDVKSLPLDLRLELCTKIASKGSDLARDLSLNFHKLGIREEILYCLNSTERFELCCKIVDQGEWAAAGLAKVIEELSFENADAHFRYSLSLKIAEKGEMAATALANRIDLIGLGEFSVYKRLVLAKKIIEQGFEASSMILGRFDQLNLETWAALYLCARIAEQGGKQAENVANTLSFLSFRYSEFDEMQIQQLSIVLKTIQRKGVSIDDFFQETEFPHFVRKKILLDLFADPTFSNSFKFQYALALDTIKPCLDILLFHLPRPGEKNYETKKNEFLNLEKSLEQHLSIEKSQAFLLKIFSAIQHNSTFYHRFQLMQWLCYTAAVFSDLEGEKLNEIAQSDLLNSIYKHQNLKERYHLVRELRVVVSTHFNDIKKLPRLDEKFTTLEENAHPEGLLHPLKKIKHEWGKLSWILLSNLKLSGLSEEATLVLGTCIDFRRFDRTKDFSILLSFLLNLLELGCFGRENSAGHECMVLENYLISLFWDNKVLDHDRIKLLTQKKTRHGKKDQVDAVRDLLIRNGMIDGKTRKPTKKSSKTLQQILQETQSMENVLVLYGRESFFHCLSSQSKPDDFFLANFQQLFPIGTIADLKQAFDETFRKFRDPRAIFSYLNKVKQLPQHEKEEVHKIFSDYVDCVLCGTFLEKRYSTEGHPHLQKLFKECSRLKERWMNKEEARFISEFPHLLISETDDPCDLLLFATEIHSCQDISGNPEHNKCLPSYLMGGEIRLIAVKDKNGKLVARSILRLIWDETKQHPVLLQERIYSNEAGNQECVEEEIKDWAIRKAKYLECPLVIDQSFWKKIYEAEYPMYDGKLVYLGGRAPFVYSDEGGGVKTGPFLIPNLCQIYPP